VYGTIAVYLDEGLGGTSFKLIRRRRFRKDKRIDSLKLKGANPSLSSLLGKLRAGPDKSRGPAYHCRIELAGENVSFHYWYEADAIADRGTIQRNIVNTTPAFLYDHLSFEELLDLVDGAYELDDLIDTYVSRRLSGAKTVPELLLDLYALLDWQGDMDNGSVNQFFARNTDLAGHLKREDLYPRIDRALATIGHQAGRAYFRESIALFAHFFPRVEAAREALGIRAVPRQEQSDIASRYHEVRDEVVEARYKYVCENGFVAHGDDIPPE